MAKQNLTKFDKQTRFIKALILLGTVEAACEEIKIARGTYYNWLKDENFREKIKDVEHYIYNDSLDTMVQMFQYATGIYTDLLFSNNEAIKLRTATAVFKNMSHIIKTRKYADEYLNWIDIRFDKPMQVLPDDYSVTKDENTLEQKSISDKL